MVLLTNPTKTSIPMELRNFCPILDDFLPMECMLSLEIFLVNVLSSTCLYLSTMSFLLLESLMNAATSAIRLMAFLKSSLSL